MLQNILTFSEIKKYGAKVLILTLSLTCFSTAFSQNSEYHLDSILNFSDIPITSNSISRNVCIKSIDDKIFISHIKKNRFYLYEYSHQTKKLVQADFKLKDNYSISTRPIDFIIDDDTIYLLLNRSIHYLSRTKKKEVFSVNCGEAEYLFKSKNQLITGFYYNYHPADYPHKAGLKKFNLKGNIIDSLFIDIPFPEYTHYLPRKLITYNNHKFVFPLFSGLDFLFVDNDFRTIDTLSISNEILNFEWITPSIKLSDLVAKNIDDLSMCWKLLDQSNSKKISRIEFVEFTDSNNLLVRFYNHDTSSKYNLRYILNLKKDENRWKLSRPFALVETPLPFNTDLNIFSGGMPLLSQNHLISYTKDFIYQVKIDIPFIKNSSYKEYYTEKKEMEKLHEPIVALWIFKYE